MMNKINTIWKKLCSLFKKKTASAGVKVENTEINTVVEKRTIPTSAVVTQKIIEMSSNLKSTGVEVKEIAKKKVAKKTTTAKKKNETQDKIKRKTNKKK